MSAAEPSVAVSADYERGTVFIERGATRKDGKLVCNAQQMKTRLDGLIADHRMLSRLSIIYVSIKGEDVEVGLNVMAMGEARRRIIDTIAQWCKEES